MIGGEGLTWRKDLRCSASGDQEEEERAMWVVAELDPGFHSVYEGGGALRELCPTTGRECSAALRVIHRQSCNAPPYEVGMDHSVRLLTSIFFAHLSYRR